MNGLARSRSGGLSALAVALLTVAATLGAGGVVAPDTAAATTYACPSVQTPSGYVQAENARPGTSAWRLQAGRRASRLQAYADRVSVSCGQSVRVFVSTRARRARLIAYRMGYYNGAGAREVLRTAWFRTHRQRAAVVDPTTHMARARWRVSTSFTVDGRFTPGSYLLKVVDRRGSQRYVPLTVTDPTSVAPLALMSEPMTWQAYNMWGGASAYYGPGHKPRLRARVVSFDRPYDRHRGAATYFVDEYPLVRAVEQAGLDVDYVTDVDVHQHPDLLLHHQGVLLGSHPEYWSRRMRDGFEAARDGGVNLAFLGADAAYWQVRLSSSPLGASRTMAIYKSAKEDPVASSAPQLTTVRWRDAPVNRPESALVGQQYQGSSVLADMVLDTPAWPFDVPPGTVLHDVVLNEYDRVGVGPAPPTLQVLATSPLTCRGTPSFANVTYYTTSSGAGVFSAGTLGWVCHLNGSCGGGTVSTEQARTVLTDTTLRLATAMASGPLGPAHPSTPTTPLTTAQPTTPSVPAVGEGLP